MKLQYFPITRAEEIDPALERVAIDRPDALFVSAEQVQFAHARKFVDFAIARRMIIVSNVGGMVDQGALLCHEPDRPAIRKRVASYVDRILRGANPANLPVELPTKFQVLVNAKTARAIGYKFPQSLLSRADRVIE